MMENPIHIFRKATGTHQSGHGLQNIKNGVSIGKQHATLLSASKITLSENTNASLLTGIGVPILSSSCPTSQDGVLLHCDDSATLLPADKTAALLATDFIPTSEFETVADVDVEKVDQWLKGRSDVCSAITYEFDSEMKATQEDIFPDDRSLLEDVHLNLASKDQLVSVAELLDTEVNSTVISKQKSVKIEVKSSMAGSGLQESSREKILPDHCNVGELCTKEIECPATYSSPYIVDSSQLDLVEDPENQTELVGSDITACKNEQINNVEQTMDCVTTVSIQSESKDFVLISIKTGTNEQIFRVKSSLALDPNQALTLQNLVSQPVILPVNQDVVSAVTSEPEASVHLLDAKPPVEEPSPENVEIFPWVPTISRVRGKFLSCPICDMHFTKETKLRIHVLSHNSNRPHKCTFSDCDWAFSSEYRLKRHLVSHMGKKNYTCSECNHCFTTKYNLKSHEVLHQRPENVICPTAGCGKAFTTRRKMEFHLKEHQEIDAPYKCPFSQCGKTFYSANYLSSHLRGHQYSKEDLSCPIEGCGRSFARICQLRQHMRQHTGERPYVCDFPKCGWKFSSASKLTRHVRKHTGERKYVCPEPGCNKSFMRPEHLKGHIVVHSGGKPFVCEYPCCNARFTAKSSLYVHMKKHTGDMSKPVFPCPITGCTKKYNFKAHFRAHMLKVHASSLVKSGSLESIDYVLEPEEEDGDLEPAPMDTFEEQDDKGLTTVKSELTMVTTPSTESTLVSFSETGSVVDVPQLIIPDNLGQHLPPDLLALASEGQLTLTSSGTGQILINPADLLTTTVTSGSDHQNAHSLLSDMDQLLLGVEESSPVVGTNIAAGSPLDTSVSGVLGAGPAIEVADGGSARTDYSSNLILSSRAKRRRQLQQQFREQELGSAEKCDADLPPLDERSGMLSAADVVLSSSSISLRDSEIAQPLLPADSPSTSDIYPDDAILTSELPSLLSEPSTINPDSGIFVVPTIHLSDLV